MAMILQNATWKSDPIKLIFIRELFVTLPHPRKNSDSYCNLSVLRERRMAALP